MAEDGEKNRQERAANIREQIEELKQENENPTDEPDMKPGESPKEYIARRMRELDQRTRKKK